MKIVPRKLACEHKGAFRKLDKVKKVDKKNTSTKSESKPNANLAVNKARMALLLVRKSLSAECIKVYFKRFHNVIQYCSFIEVPKECCDDLIRGTRELGNEVSVVKFSTLCVRVPGCSQRFSEFAEVIHKVVLKTNPSYNLKLSMKSSLLALSCESVKTYFQCFKEISEKTEVKINFKLRTNSRYTIELDGKAENCFKAIALVSSELASVYKNELIYFTIKNSLAGFITTDCTSYLGDYMKYLKVKKPTSGSILDDFAENICVKGLNKSRSINYKHLVEILHKRCQKYLETNTSFTFDMNITGSTVEHLHNNQNKKILEAVTACQVFIPARSEIIKHFGRKNYKVVLVGNVNSVQSAFLYIVSFDVSFSLKQLLH